MMCMNIVWFHRFTIYNNGTIKPFFCESFPSNHIAATWSIVGALYNTGVELNSVLIKIMDIT
jgi:hypothetical protein